MGTKMKHHELMTYLGNMRSVECVIALSNEKEAQCQASAEELHRQLKPKAGAGKIGLALGTAAGLAAAAWAGKKSKTGAGKVLARICGCAAPVSLAAAVLLAIRDGKRDSANRQIEAREAKVKEAYEDLRAERASYQALRYQGYRAIRVCLPRFQNLEGVSALYDYCQDPAHDDPYEYEAIPYHAGEGSMNRQEMEEALRSGAKEKHSGEGETAYFMTPQEEASLAKWNDAVRDRLLAGEFVYQRV